jgi:putative hemolysin
MLTDALLLMALIATNGLLAMSEIAVVSSRRARLLQMVESGSRGATRALQLSGDPTRFLSTVQVGITSIGILSGAVGEATIAGRLRVALSAVPVVAPYADVAALIIMVIGLTYVSLIIGELVPKRLAMTRPEYIASLIARPMQWLASVTRPVVYLLSLSTDTILALLRAKKTPGPAVTLEEFKLLIEQGAAEGVFEKTEQEIVTNVLDLDDRHVTEVITPRSEIVYLDLQDSFEENRERLKERSHSVVPLCDGGLDTVAGFVRATDLLQRTLSNEPLDLRALATPPLFVPHTMSIMKLLEQFKRMHLPLALVVDEFGNVDGLVSLADVMTAIVGHLPPEPGEEPLIVKRSDGTWLVDGMLALDTLSREIGIDALAAEVRDHYHTVAGLAMYALGRMPKTGDVFERDGFRFEIVDMDGHRVDRVLVARIAKAPAAAHDGAPQ